MARILQLTDLHVFAEPGIRLKGIPTRECLQDVVEHILTHEAAFDHVIITGDHTHDELEASYRAVQEILSPWNDRLWQVPGNHDDRAVLRSIFGDRVAGAVSERIGFQFTTDEWLCVGLDTHWPGEVAGRVGEAQTDWLARLLNKSSAKQVALFCHHPPVDVNSVWMDRIGLTDRNLLHTVVENDPRVRLICCGHVHHEFQSTLGNANVLTTPSTGIQFDPVGDVARFATAAPGCRVIEFTGDDYSTHVVRLPETKYSPVAD